MSQPRARTMLLFATEKHQQDATNWKIQHLNKKNAGGGAAKCHNDNHSCPEPWWPYHQNSYQHLRNNPNQVEKNRTETNKWKYFWIATRISGSCEFIAWSTKSKLDSTSTWNGERFPCCAIGLPTFAKAVKEPSLGNWVPVALTLVPATKEFETKPVCVQCLE